MEEKKTQRAKTYTERVEDLEATVFAMANTINEVVNSIGVQANMISFLRSKMENSEGVSVSQGQVLQALVDNLTKKTEITESDIAKSVETVQLNALRKNIDSKVEAKLWTPSESISADSDVVVYTIKDKLALAFSEVSNLKEELKEKVMNAKAGDLLTFNDSDEELVFEIKEVYSTINTDSTSASLDGTNVVTQ